MTSRSQYNGNSMNAGNGNALPAWLRYDPLYCDIYRQRPHQVTP